MSQEQPQPIKYGDVFEIQGDLASKPIAPQDAATMKAAESMTFGKTVKGGPATVMQLAATVNEQHGVVGHFDSNEVGRDQGVIVTDTVVGGRCVLTEAIGDQVVGQYYTQPTLGQGGSPTTVMYDDPITIGEALEATAFCAGDKPVDQSNAAAIEAAEMRATGRNVPAPGGVGAAAQSAAALNERVMLDEDKIKLGDLLDRIVLDASVTIVTGTGCDKLGGDKPATIEDAVGVIAAEVRNDPAMSTHPGGVAEAVTTAAKMNMK